MKKIDNTRTSISPYDIAPKSMAIIGAIEDAGVKMSPRLLNKVANLQEEFADIRRDDNRIVAKLTKKLRAKYTYHTNSIEGNTLTESETRSFIETGMTVSGKSIKEYTEARNIPSALDMLIDMAGETQPLLKTSDILELHSLVVEGIEEASPGYFRKGFVRLANSTYVPPPAYELDLLVNEIVAYVNKNPHKLSPLELAFKTHLWFVSIHPFEDGNGRVARLLTGLILMKHKLPPIIIKTEHKKRYLSVLRKTQLKDVLKPYYDFMGEEYVATLTEFITAARQVGPGDQLVSLADAARKYKLSVDYLGFLARTGEINAAKNGGRWMIRVKDIENYVRKRNRRNQQEDPQKTQ